MILTILLSLFAIVSCGLFQETEQASPPASGSSTSDPVHPVDTRYGSIEQVTQYLKAIAPYIAKVGQIQSSVEQQLSSRPMYDIPHDIVTGADHQRRGTGKNLSGEIAKVRPEIVQIMNEFKEVQPPPLLAPLHRDIEKLMGLRLTAYDRITKGSQTENAGENFRPHYDAAQEDLKRANELILQLNKHLQKVNASLQQAEQSPAEG